MSKNLLFALTASLLSASYSTAYPFDANRFFSGNSQHLRIIASKHHLEELGQEDAFELSSSGRIDVIPTVTGLNTFEYTRSRSDQKESLDTQRLSHVDPNQSSNMLYSVSAIGTRADNECGPSPMTAADIEELVGRTAQSYGVDPGLAKAIAWTESRFDRNRNSPKGARGPMQLMPVTAIGLGVNNICDPVANIDGGVRHLKLMLEEFQNPILAVAAYNAGAQAVYDNGGVPPFGETVRYVASVINHQMGLQVPRKPTGRDTAAGAPSPSANEMTSDVIGGRGSQFIKGVMQF